ncbi:hypothetical protein IAR50_006755 [Cryptococcus sp. DSM 104548]
MFTRLSLQTRDRQSSARRHFTSSRSLLGILSDLARTASHGLRDSGSTTAKPKQSGASLSPPGTTQNTLQVQAQGELEKDLSFQSSFNHFQRATLSRAPSLHLISASKKDVRSTRHLSKRRLAGSYFKGPNEVVFEGRDGTIVGGIVSGSEGAIEGVSDDPFTDDSPSSTSHGKAGRGNHLPVASSTIESGGVQITDIQPPPTSEIATLHHNLDHVLFNDGVQHLQDPQTGAWNFDSFLQDIPAPSNYAYHRSPGYVPPSQDPELLRLAEQHSCQFYGSTSTVSKALSQIYFAISGRKGVDISYLSKGFKSERSAFTKGAELPAAIVLNRTANGHYAIDNDKAYDVENVLSDFGHIMEKMLTTSSTDFQRFLKTSPEDAVSEEERTKREAYHHMKVGSLMLRSQLDCRHSRLPGSGVFDIKTRACFPVRYDSENYIANSVYDIAHVTGMMGSYEREYYDLTRSAMLKYSFQVRIGAMEGIFVAYHSTSRMFGFQYISLAEMDKRVFGSSEMADAAFKNSVSILEQLLQHCTSLFPSKSVNIIMSHTPAFDPHSVTAYVQPKDWSKRDGPCPVQAVTFKMENFLDACPVTGPMPAYVLDPKTGRAPSWSIKSTITKCAQDTSGHSEARVGLQRSQARLLAMTKRFVPEGETVESMTRLRGSASCTVGRAGDQKPAESQKIIWKEPSIDIERMRQEVKESGRRYEERKRAWSQ